MDKLNFIRDGGSKLPPGFRFEPTDEEIVFTYLARKIFSHPLPALIIPEINNMFSFDPWELPGNSDQERYFYSNKETNHRIAGRATCSGYWKSTASSKRIICSKMKPMIGIRKSLVFYKSENGRAFRTDWIMHEYYIALSENTSENIQHRKNSQCSNLVRVGDWTLCRVFMEKTNGMGQVDDSENIGRNCEFMAEDYMSDAAPSCASSTSPHFDNSSCLNDEVSSSFANI